MVAVRGIYQGGDTVKLDSMPVPVHEPCEVVVAFLNPVQQREDPSETSEVEKMRHNMAFTEKLQQRIKALDEGKGIVKTMAELEALANE
jgi:hypothetical protein